MGRGTLAGIAEIAELFGVSRHAAVRYTKRADFPEPLDRLAAGPVWLRKDVEKWGKNTLPLAPGRPPQGALVPRPRSGRGGGDPL